MSSVADTRSEAILDKSPGRHDSINHYPLGAILLGGSGVWVFISQLKSEWTVNPQYSFGWGVPVLGLILLVKRWKDRPSLTNPSARWIALFSIVLLSAWLPIRILREANMDWRLLEWVIGFWAVGAILVVFAGIGGKAFARHFAAPVLFLLLAIPWPTQLESGLAQWLSAGIVQVTVEALRWMGIPAWSAGSLIQVPGVTVGVEEACSGIRALQGAFMSAVFVGELYRTSRFRRFALILLGIIIACAVNFTRAFWLAYTAAQSGVNDTESLHGAAGLLAVGICFLILWLTGSLFTRDRSTSASTEPEPNSAVPAFRPAFVIGCITWLALVEAITHRWYSTQQTGAFVEAELRLQDVSDLKISPISEQVRSTLRFDQAESYQRSPSDGTHWWIYNIRWAANGAGANLARYHSPEICLPAAGFRSIESNEIVRADVAEGVPFRFLRYEWLGQPVYVFSSYRSTAGGLESVRRFEDFDLTWRNRLSAAFRRERLGTQQVVQIVIAGASSEAHAVATFRDFTREALTMKRSA